MDDVKEKPSRASSSIEDEKDLNSKSTYVHDRRERKLDEGVTMVRKRTKWYQYWNPKYEAPPPKATLAEAEITPLATAGFFSVLFFSWITPMMSLGYARTLQATDLWKLDKSRSAGYLGEELEKSWARRREKAALFNEKLEKGEIKPSLWVRGRWWVRRWRKSAGTREDQEARWRKDSRKTPSLAWALNDVLGGRFWWGGVYKVFGDVSQLMAPLVVRAIIRFGQQNFAAHGNPAVKKPSVVGGVFMAVALLFLSMFQNIGQQQFFWQSMSTGIMARTALISCIYKRGVYLNPSARKQFDNSRLLHFVSGDVSRVDAAAQWFHAAWTAPIQITICIIILLIQLGPSSLIGFALFLLLIPFQEYLMKHQMKVRKATSELSDQRMAILGECLSGMKVIKWFCYENRFMERLSKLRAKELKGVWKIELNSSLNLAVAFTVPVIAGVLSFIAYLLTAHSFDVAIIFSSLALFNLLRQPLMFLPRAMSGIADAKSALKRLMPLFEASLSEEKGVDVDPSITLAVEIKSASFVWEESLDDAAESKKHGGKKKGRKGPPPPPADITAAKTGSPPFGIDNITLEVPRGQVVAIVGPVGSGKSSLLQGMVGEMRRTGGSVKFGGKVAYCSQVAWIQNTSLRENVLFGQPFEEDRYWKALDHACLMPDLEVLPDGDLTEIGEKGINLSGGQKQRVNIARALYCDADIVILDDPLSAVDAHVGKALFKNAIMGDLKGHGKTVILVTHALHFVSEVDYNYTVKNGEFAEQGKYDELMEQKQEFWRLLVEYGGASTVNGKTVAAEEMEEVEDGEGEGKAKVSRVAGVREGKPEKDVGLLITKEKRNTGGVSWKVYMNYIRSGRGWVTAPLVLACAIFMQTSQILNSYLLVWWQANTFNLSEATYALIYAMLGIAQAFFTFALGMTIATMAQAASHRLHDDSVDRVFHARISFFDTTPLGRLISVFGKDFDSIDNQLTLALRMFCLVLASGIGAVVIVVILEHYFVIAIVIVSVGYMYLANFYGSSSREMKRLDSMLRSWLYAHFSESLTGIPIIKAYRAMDMFTSDNEYYVDLENRALFLTVTNQRWLAVRLGVLGTILTFIVALFAILGTSGISPAQIGLILTYTTQLSQILMVITRQSTEVENYMNAVERVVEYTDGDIVPQEAAYEIPAAKPGPSWPNDGSVDWQGAQMAYREGLPNVLKGLDFDIRGGEKLGVVGRTGAGKSSLVMVLFRIAELNAGNIVIDGVDIAKIGLTDLRTKLSIIPQEPLLFSGTIRSNLDPFNLYEDAHLWDALRRACLVDADEGPVGSDATPTTRFSLESQVEAEGLNLSVGQRSLLSLARALVKNTQIVILDEATASVDLETDSKIQTTIQSEFEGRTLICIAHRLRTILSYDRILVMDAGEVAELDTPLNLFDKKDGILRGMCDRSHITRQDIEKAQKVEKDS